MSEIIEKHPFEPFLPENAKLLMLGTFPPAEKRWCMIPFLNEKGIAMYDTATKIRRTKDNASDKDLEIVEETDLDGMLRTLPECKAVITAGQLATDVFCNHYGIKSPKVGEFAEFLLDDRELRLYRMPSSSRAYPMRAERKADYYNIVFKYLEL